MAVDVVDQADGARPPVGDGDRGEVAVEIVGRSACRGAKFSPRCCTPRPSEFNLRASIPQLSNKRGNRTVDLVDGGAAGVGVAGCELFRRGKLRRRTDCCLARYSETNKIRFSEGTPGNAPICTSLSGTPIPPF